MALQLPHGQRRKLRSRVGGIAVELWMHNLEPAWPDRAQFLDSVAAHGISILTRARNAPTLRTSPAATNRGRKTPRASHPQSPGFVGVETYEIQGLRAEDPENDLQGDDCTADQKQVPVRKRPRVLQGRRAKARRSPAASNAGKEPGSLPDDPLLEPCISR